MSQARGTPATTGWHAAGRWLVVNADDFGISPGVNRGIVDAHRRGLVTSASLMTNLPAAEDALAQAAGCPDLAIGLHLTLTAGRPLSPPNRVPTLVDAGGRFLVLRELLARLSLGRVDPGELERELAAQAAWAIERGVRPDHIDSHHHVHVHPRVACSVLRVAERYEIPFVRCPVEALEPAAPRDVARTAIISLFGRLLRPTLRARGLRTARNFRGIRLGYGFGTRALVRTLGRLPVGLTELMTHPGRPDAELARLTDFVAGRERELAALVAAESRAALERRGAALTTFREAARPASYT